jgi:hypothetical protein
MTTLANLSNLIDYSKDIAVQKQALQLSTIFNPVEKIEIMQIIEALEQKVNTRINTFQDLNDALNL